MGRYVGKVVEHRYTGTVEVRTVGTVEVRTVGTVEVRTVGIAVHGALYTRSVVECKFSCGKKLS